MQQISRRFVTRLLLVACLAAGVVASRVSVIGQQRAAAATPGVTAEDNTKWMTDLSNEGRWGKDDQRGTLNLVTPAKRKQAVALVREGTGHAGRSCRSRRVGEVRAREDWQRRRRVPAHRAVAAAGTKRSVERRAQRRRLAASVMPWLKARDVALLGNDAVNDVQPSGVEGNGRPIHQLATVAMGLPLIDVMDLEAVAGTAAR